LQFVLIDFPLLHEDLLIRVDPGLTVYSTVSKPAVVDLFQNDCLPVGEVPLPACSGFKHKKGLVFYANPFFQLQIAFLHSIARLINALIIDIAI
jgi:hypothetical protein